MRNAEQVTVQNTRHIPYNATNNVSLVVIIHVNISQRLSANDSLVFSDLIKLARLVNYRAINATA